MCFFLATLVLLQVIFSAAEHHHACDEDHLCDRVRHECHIHDGVDGRMGVQGIPGPPGPPGIAGANCTTTTFTGSLGPCTSGGSEINCTFNGAITTSLACNGAVIGAPTIFTFNSGVITGVTFNSDNAFGTAGVYLANGAFIGSNSPSMLGPGYGIALPGNGTISNIVVRTDAAVSVTNQDTIFNFTILLNEVPLNDEDGLAHSKTDMTTTPVAMLAVTFQANLVNGVYFATAHDLLTSYSITANPGSILQVKVSSENFGCCFNNLIFTASLTYTESP